MVEFDKKVLCGPSYVALREVQKNTTHNLNVGGIVLADTSLANEKLGHYIIEDIGEIAAYEFDLKVGDYVLADKLASFYHSQPVCLMTYNNIILKTNHDRTEIHPVKNKIIVEEDKSEIVNTGGIYLQTNPDKLRFGKIIEMNVVPDPTSPVKDYPFKEGDHVMLVRKGDMVSIGNKTYWIFDPDQIICKLLED